MSDQNFYDTVEGTKTILNFINSSLDGLDKYNINSSYNEKTMNSINFEVKKLKRNVDYLQQKNRQGNRKRL